MSEQSICAPHLDLCDRCWYVRDGIQQDTLPVSGLGHTGVAHVSVPLNLLAPFSVEGLATNWLSTVPDATEISSVDSLLSQPVRELGEHIAQATRGRFQGAAIKKIEYEWNNFHFDISDGLATPENYFRQDAVSDEDWSHWKDRLSLFCCMPFPIHAQAGTVCVPRGGEFRELQVQSPPGYVTLFFKQVIWHRGDRWLGAPRGLFMMGLHRPFL
jgi:hypothetical protein